MHPLEVFAIDAKMNRCTGSIPYRSLIWRRRYYECGEFEMVVPANIYDPSWRYILSDERPEMGIVQKVEFTDDSQTYGGIDSITISGFFMESLLNNVTFLDEQPETVTETYYVPPPTNVVYHKDQMTEVYVDGAGDYAYRNSQGDIVYADNGNQVGNFADLEQVDYVTDIDAPYTPDTYSTYYNYYSEDGKTLHRVGLFGDETTHQIEFKDDKGNAYWKDEAGYLRVGLGCKETKQDGFMIEMWQWEAGGGYTRTRDVTVKGPWQLTDTYEPVTEGDSVEIVMKWAQRMMGNWLAYAEPTFEGVQKKVNPSFQLLGDLIYATLKEVGASIRLLYSFVNNAYLLEPWKGKDRTQDQTDIPWAVFSDTWGTLTAYSASRDDSNYRNTCYVLFDYDVPSFDSAGRPVVEPVWEMVDNLLVNAEFKGWRVPYKRKRSYFIETVGDGTEPRRETYLDLRQDKPSCDGDWSRDTYDPGSYPESSPPVLPIMKPTYEAYEQHLHDQGVQHLRDNYGVVTSLDTGTVDTAAYLRDWDLGDLVEMSVSTVGLQAQARIIGVDETYDENGASVEISIGDKKVDIIEKARLP